MSLLGSGADHEAVSRANPHWTVEDWCWYWHKDFMKIMKKHSFHPSQYKGLLREECEALGCVCKQRLHG